MPEQARRALDPESCEAKFGGHQQVDPMLDPRFGMCRRCRAEVHLVPIATMKRRPKRGDQNARVLSELRAAGRGGWVCGTAFVHLTPPILRYSARVSDLKKEGFAIRSRKCQQHDHAVYEFTLEEATWLDPQGPPSRDPASPR